jgi:integrase/recombinase XerD
MKIYKNPKIVINFLENSGLSENTIKNYSNALSLFFKHISNKKQWGNTIENISLKDIQDIKIEDCYDFLKICKSNTDKNKKIAAIKCLFGYLNEMYNYSSTISKLKMVKIPERLPIHLSDKQVEKFLVNSKTKNNSERNYCIAVFFVNIGIRLSELKNLNLSNINKDKLFVIGKGNKERMVIFNPSCQSALKNWLAVRPKCNSDALFITKNGTRLSERAIQKIIKLIMKNSNLSKKYSVHKLRHTCATLLKENGVSLEDIQEQLGHKNLETTQIYAHITEKTKRETANSINLF